MGSVIAFIPLFLFEVMVLIGVAGWLGVDHVAVLLERLSHWIMERNAKKS
jgi:UPF0716 family protein affecting phage T7 exclusion